MKGEDGRKGTEKRRERKTNNKSISIFRGQSRGHHGAMMVPVTPGVPPGTQMGRGVRLQRSTEVKALSAQW